MDRHLCGPGVLARIVAGEVEEFALLHRPESGDPDTVDVLLGPVGEVASLAELPVPDPAPAGSAHDLLALVPYRQVAERGFAAVDDGAPLLVMRVDEQHALPLADVLAALPDHDLAMAPEGFDIDDEAYARLVREVITREIGSGTGANFVLRRTFAVRFDGAVPAAALTVFRRLMKSELSAYWTFVVHTPTTTLVGATPERHASVERGIVTMNPISGTYRYAEQGPNVTDVLDFLADGKETDELYMVLDEELKMMAAMCPDGGRVRGPFLKPMAALAHTEYLIDGHSGFDVRDVLRTTMFAPTVTGSPQESACRVIAAYEPDGRRYYSGALALIGHDADGAQRMDSAILIRTGELIGDGRLRVSVGATVVRHSDPWSEVRETAAKAEGMLSAVRGSAANRTAASPDAARALGRDEAVMTALGRRNERLGRFWFRSPADRAELDQPLRGTRVLVIDAEDTFTAMLGLQIHGLGPDVTIRRFDEPYDLHSHDLVLVGPGPGDPRRTEHHKIAALRALTSRLLAEGRPFLSVCLGHQVLCDLLGLDLVRRDEPNQGAQVDIDLFGVDRRVGFYNTFTALTPNPPIAGMLVSADATTGQVHALRGPNFRSLQFHPESVLTEHGPEILRIELVGLVYPDRGRATVPAHFSVEESL